MKSTEKNPSTLEELVPRYRVGFRIQPGEAAGASGRVAQITCHLQLSGHHDNRVQSSGASCAACIQVLQSLLEVVGTLRSVERETLEKAGGACETRAHYASVSGPGHEVTLGVEMILRSPHGAMTDSWAWIFMQRSRAALTGLGCRNLAPAEPVDRSLAFPAVQRRQIGCGVSSGDAMERMSRLIA